jgi:HD-GYP domain-containing protein (c-di-GMP phosphodiesterase class II)
MSADAEINPHYLGHVVNASESHDIEVCEDIVAGNGTKLLAKGTRINAAVRERLLQHKLRKPLEDCVRVAGGTDTAKLVETAQALFDHHLLMRELCGGTEGGLAALRKVHLSGPVQSLLTVYVEHRPNKLAHAVGAGLLAYALARRLAPQDTERHQQILLAGLLHDVGELYIDPRILDQGHRLEPAQWKHIVTHPIVGHRLLKDMDGAGPMVADAVLQHHERLDGFGYPAGLRGPGVGLGGQLLSVAELLVGLLESAGQPLMSATVALKLIPGEFSRGALDAVVSASQLAATRPAPAPKPTDTGRLAARVRRLAGLLRRFRTAAAAIDKDMSKASPALKALLEHAIARMHRIHLAFSSTGLDAANARRVVQQLTLPGPDGVQTEASIVLRELEWRMKELERESLMRVQMVAPQDAEVVRRLIGVVKGTC